MNNQNQSQNSKILSEVSEGIEMVDGKVDRGGFRQIVEENSMDFGIEEDMAMPKHEKEVPG
jgi:hypothetical protein